MFMLPSVWNIIISTIVFIVAAWYIRRYLNEQAIPAGIARGLMVFILASVVSWGAGTVVDWVQEKVEGPQPAAKNSDDLLKLLELVRQTQ